MSQVRWYPWRYQSEAVRNETILYVFVYTGLRLQELLDLELMDISLEAREIMVRQGKGQKDRVVPIHPRLASVLRRYVAQLRSRGHSSPYLFTGVQSMKPLSGKDVRIICQKLSHASGCYFTPHMLRHTFGRLAVEAGMDIFKIKEIMGHSSIATTQGYLSVSTENLKLSMLDLHLL